MLLLETDSLRPGPLAAAPVRHPTQPAVDLVMPGVELDAGMIRTLTELEVQKMWVRWSGLEFLDAALNVRLIDLRDEAHGLLKRTFEDGRVKTVSVTEYVRYCNLVNALLIELVAAERNGPTSHTAILFDKGRGLFRHSANVTYLALTLGLHLQGYVVRQRRSAGSNAPEDLTNLGVGAMLHDIGKLQVPSTQEIHEPFLDTPSRAYRQHPRRGCQMISERISATARAVVLHHHQHFDGTGFPDLASVTRQRRQGALTGRDIHVFPRIVSLCDTFEHLCQDGQGNARPAVAALFDLLGADLGGRFDPVILRGLLRQVPPFVPGMKVTLSDGRPAAVISLNKDEPCRPVVRLLDEKNSTAGDVALADNRNLHIAEALGLHVENWLFELPPPARLDEVTVGANESA